MRYIYISQALLGIELAEVEMYVNIEKKPKVRPVIRISYYSTLNHCLEDALFENLRVVG